MASQVPVQMHPQASRHVVVPRPECSTSSASTDGASPDASSLPSPLATSPFFPQLDSILPPSHTTLRRSPSLRPPASSPAASTPTPATSARSHSGLQVDPTQYPLYSLAPHAPPIRVITAAQYAELHERESKANLDEKELFPWSHGGADVPDSLATRYFGFATGQCAKTPNYRGLTTIKAPAANLPSPSTGGGLRRKLTSSFASWSSASSSTHSSSSSSDRSPSASPPPNTPTCRLVSSFEAKQILATDPSTQRTTFALPSLPAQVNLRHFALQGPKYASISDIVVYGENGIDESVVETARQAKEAMDYEREKRGGAGLEYNVYVIAEPFSVFESSYLKLVAIDSLGFARNRLNFFEREKEEMRVLTQASEIGENVWLGNTQDVPLAAKRSRHLSSDSTSSLLDDGNPHSFAVCVECHDNAPLLSSELLGQVERELDVLQEQGQAFEEVRRLLDGEAVVEAKTTVLRPQVEDIMHFESLSSPIALGSSNRARTAYVNKVVDLACWIRDQANPPFHTNRLPRRVLLHCPDGYTETTLLALAYVMVSRRLSAADAYLFVQEDCERSFFVYPTDKETIAQIERRVVDIIAREDEEEDRAIEWENSQRAESAGMERSDSGFVDSTEDPLAAATAQGQGKVARPIPIPERTQMRVSDPVTDAWFFGPTFEGHFPSRILPFLYLGNLNHASNALMLKELGITHVVSLGESALTPPQPPNFSFSKTFSSGSRPQAPQNSLWLEERHGKISVLDLKNFADDGIDSIQPHIDEAVAFIEDARRRGGKTLVHCKVGVSRSASIVIAYLMKEVALDLASAYLLTRSRRLNILIQPNLPFMAALHAFEASLLEDKDRQLASSTSSATGSEPLEYSDDDDTLQYLGLAGLKRSNRLGWSFLCSEVARLNERFLC
ncbi:hypothetical protein JCM10212_004468 [Sporobolomyces blumeae]